MSSYEKKVTSRGLGYLKWRYWDNRNEALPAELQSPLQGALGGAEQDMLEHGIMVRPSASILTEAGQKALAEVQAELLAKCASPKVVDIVSGKTSRETKKPFVVHLVDPDVEANSASVRLGLDENVLKIVARYLQMVPFLHAVKGWMHFPTDGDAIESQLWHRDLADHGLVKVFYHLNDVGEDTGPFSYVTGSHARSRDGFRTPEYADRKRILDPAMEAVYPRGRWKVCTGPAGTMILADTIGFHKGGKPDRGNRILVTMTYTSSHPMEGRNIRVFGKPDPGLSALQSRALAFDYKGKVSERAWRSKESM